MTRSWQQLWEPGRTITAIHALIYSDDVDTTRSFLRDVLGLPFVNDADVPDGSDTGWLIFGTGPSELGGHPTRAEHDGQIWQTHRHVELSFMCDDVAVTREDLESKRAQFDGDIADRGWGLVTMLTVRRSSGHRQGRLEFQSHCSLSDYTV